MKYEIIIYHNNHLFSVIKQKNYNFKTIDVYYEDRFFEDYKYELKESFKYMNYHLNKVASYLSNEEFKIKPVEL